MVSFEADFYHVQIVCEPEDLNIPKCGFTLQKIIIMMISASSTILLTLLSIKLKEVVFLINFVIAVVSVLSVFIYMFGIVGNDGYKNVSQFVTDKSFYRERFFPPIIEDLAITVS